MTENKLYDNPLITRYAGRTMSELWGPQRKFRTWRRLWVALAQAEHELGLPADDGKTPRITASQLGALRSHIDDIDFARADALERRFRHDVMAHIHAFGEACPEAKDIIHLGATSCFVTDNTDLILMREGLEILRTALVSVIDALARFAEQWKDLPTLGFTHFQPAQLTTVGKRASLWCYDFLLDLEEIEHRLANLRFRGVKGTTGTQASFLALFKDDHDKVRKLDRLVARRMGFESVFPITGQTYSRKIDSQMLDALSGICQSAHKYGTDLRLLAHRQEVEEPFEAEQVGSSAMAYKRNPMRAERMCGLARFVSSLVTSAHHTASVQWLERTLDDSANRRLTLPQAFLGTDAVLRLALNISRGLVVHPHVISQNVAEALPYMATENILMAAVTLGGDRQAVHERIRQHSLGAADAIKSGALQKDLLALFKSDPAFARIDFDSILDVRKFIGRAPEQVAEFMANEIASLRQRYPVTAEAESEIAV